MILTLDHVMLRAPDAAAALAQIETGIGLPVLARPERVNGLVSAVARAGSADVEILEIGAEPLATTRGYGLGFVSDQPLDRTMASLRAAGIATSVPATGVAGSGDERRRWRAIQLHGLLPDPFPVANSTRRPGARERLLETAGRLLLQAPPVARAATRRAGGSMVVVTEYGFDVTRWRARAGAGPEVLEVHVGIADRRTAWGRLPLAPRSPLVLHDGPVGISRIVLAGSPAEHRIGDVTFELRSRRA